MRVLLIFLLVSTLFSAGCRRSSTLLSKIQSAGGEAALKRECQSLLAEHERTKKDIWMASDPALPPTITALAPQVLELSVYDGLPHIYIQISGGFDHRGLMVLLTNAPPDFMPRKTGWQVTKIADGIFEYRR